VPANRANYVFIRYQKRMATRANWREKEIDNVFEHINSIYL